MTRSSLTAVTRADSAVHGAFQRQCELIVGVRQNQQGSNKQLICSNFLPTVNAKSSTGEFLQRLFHCKGNADRVALIWQHFKWIPLDSDIRRKYVKDAVKSTLCRQLGSAARDEGRLDCSAQLLSMAVLFAPGSTDESSSPELALAYASRSVTLKELDLTQEAIQDIDLALSSDYPKEREWKLVKRRRRYEADLLILRQRQQNSQLIKSQSEETSTKKKKTGEKSCMEFAFNINRPNPVMPSADDAIELMINPVEGRHLVANKTISIGTGIIVENPFIVALENALSWDMKHCHNCLRRMFHSVPCSSCVFAVYCDDKCRAEALHSYHRYECPCLAELHCNLQDDPLLHNFYLVFKLICQIGPQELYRRFHHEEEEEEEDENARVSVDTNVTPGCDPLTGVYDSTLYETVRHLTWHFNPKEGYYFPLVAVILSYTLRRNSDFFALANDDDVDNFQQYIATAMLHHFESFRRNLFSLEEVLEPTSLVGSSDDDALFQDELRLRNFAVGVYPTMSLLNHSCDPNAILVTSAQRGRSAIVTVRTVRKGEQLTISYGPHFGDGQDSLTRRDILESAYGFVCTCPACTHDWSSLLLKQLSSDKDHHLRFKCTNCSAKLVLSNAGTAGRSEKHVFSCESCKRQSSKSSLLKELNGHKERLASCERLIHIERKPCSAINLLKESLHFFEQHCSQPCCYSVMAQKLFREALAGSVSLIHCN